MAHHYDHTRRTARGRWLADDTAKNEDFAEQAAYAWTMQFAVPFIERTCPKEVDTLRRWTLRYGGTQIALGAFVRRPNSIQNAFPPRDAVSRLIEEIHAGSSLTCCRLVFAEYLHFAELYDEALKSIQTVLSEEPDNGEALTLKADVFVHQERYAEAKAIADPLIATAGATERLCRVLMDIYEGLGDWGRIIETANLALALPQDNEWDRIDALRHRARANLRSGKTSEAKTDIGELEAFESRRPTRFGGRQIQLLRQELDGIDASR